MRGMRGMRGMRSWITLLLAVLCCLLPLSQTALADTGIFYEGPEDAGLPGAVSGGMCAGGFCGGDSREADPTTGLGGAVYARNFDFDVNSSGCPQSGTNVYPMYYMRVTIEKWKYVVWSWGLPSVEMHYYARLMVHVVTGEDAMGRPIYGELVDGTKSDGFESDGTPAENAAAAMAAVTDGLAKLGISGGCIDLTDGSP